MSEFSGFPKEAITFFRDLSFNNEKEWFHAHKKEYEEYVLEPAKLFVVAMGDRLHEISPDVQAIPAVNKSLFRLNRDVRFSKDKSPYKTNMGILFWEGPKKRMENPGFYISLETDGVMIAGGSHVFPKELLPKYREAAADKKAGKELADLAVSLDKTGVPILGAHYKRVPQGYDADHPNAELLKHNGVYCMVKNKHPKELHSAKFVDYCYEYCVKMDPMNRWVLKYLY